MRAEIKQLRNFTRKCCKGNNLKCQQAGIILDCMRKKLQQSIIREGRKIVCKRIRLRAALRKHGQVAGSKLRKSDLEDIWKEYRKNTKLLERCELKLPEIISAAQIKNIAYSELVKNLEFHFQMEPGSLESINPRLKAAVN